VYLKAQNKLGPIIEFKIDGGRRSLPPLNEIIFPIFDKYPLLTSKYFNYLRFKKAYNILENKDLTTAMKNAKIDLLRSESLPLDYVSPAISHLNEESQFDNIAEVLSVYLLAGFTEAEGYFGVTPHKGRWWFIEGARK